MKKNFRKNKHSYCLGEGQSFPFKFHKAKEGVVIMKRFKKNCKGQFVIIAALLIAVLTLSLAFSVHQLNLHRQQLRYTPVNELLLGITSDLERALTKALSKDSEAYYHRWPGGAGEDFIQTWKRSVLTAYSSLSLKMNNQFEPTFVYSWGRNIAFSQASVSYNIDVDAYGFKGWIGTAAKHVRLEMFPGSINLTKPGNTSLRFQIKQSAVSENLTVPIPNLTANSIIVGSYVPSAPFFPAKVVALDYLGNGMYAMTFDQGINPHTQGISLTVITPEDKIWVSTYNYDEIYVTLQSREENGPPRNLGQIRLEETWHSINSPEPLGKPFPIFPERYPLMYSPELGYNFTRWETNGYATVEDPTGSTTAVMINGICTITAIYQTYLAPTYSVTLDSREDINETLTSYGNITFNSNPYFLPYTVSDLPSGDYSISYHTPENSSYYFIRWETPPLSPVGVWDLYSNSTMVSVSGNGAITAVYGSHPPIFTNVTVNLQSREETSPNYNNLGQIQLGANLYQLPISVTLRNVTYILEYLPSPGFDFLYWITTENIILESNSSTTLVTINGDGTITAVFRGCRIQLDSRDYNYTSFHKGQISLNSANYTLYPQPLVVVLPRGNYPLEYITENSSYVFLSWNCSGNVAPMNTWSQSTAVVVYGDGNITAIYTFIPSNDTQPPVQPPYTGEWSTLYFDDKRTLVPGYLWSGHDGHDETHSSTGKLKLVSYHICDIPSPELTLAKLVNITAYIRPTPPWSVKDIEMELGFNYNGTYYKIGNHTFLANTTQDIYQASLYTDETVFVPVYGPRVVPAGSTFILTVTVTFIDSHGFLFVYHGYDNPSRIDLF